jgi:LacI family transcriptional regulator
VSEAARTRIAILIRANLSTYLNRMVLGVAEYARLKGTWTIHGLFVGRPAAIERVHADGAIVFRGGPELVPGGTPTVYVGTRAADDPLPGTVRSDNHAIGAAAAEHLLERGLHYFAAVGDRRNSPSSKQRCGGFQARVAQAGMQFFAGPGVNADRLDERRNLAPLQRWIATLPKPVGIMGFNDVIARQLADASRGAGESVPERVAIVGIDNEELMCMLSDPPLSSVDPAASRVGYQAAALLDRIMGGERPTLEPVLVAPAGVVVRQSSDLLAIEDADVAEAVKFIRANCANTISVADVMRHVAVPRRTLDRRFRRRLGRLVGRCRRPLALQPRRHQQGRECPAGRRQADRQLHREEPRRLGRPGGDDHHHRAQRRAGSERRRQRHHQ